MKKSLNTAFLALLALGALLAAPAALRAQTLYVSTFGGAIDKVDSTGVVSLFATVPGLNQGMAFDTSGNLYGVGYYTDQMSKITPGGAVSLFATVPSALGNTGLAIDGSGNLYAANVYADQISKITPGGVVSLFATLPGGSAPTGLAFDSSGNLYAAGHNSDQISKITPGGVVSLFATLPGGSGADALAIDGSGNLYASDGGTDQISKITPGGAVSLFATLPGGSAPTGLAFDSSGNLYAADSNIGQISKISPDGLTVSTFATGFSSTPYFIAIQTTYGAQIQQPINLDGSSVFNVRRGVVPVKFTLTLDGVATCDLPPATIALTRTAGGTTGAIDENVYSGSADNGSNFRIDSCQYVYNLSSGALGAGTYRVDILIGGSVVGSGTFGLK